MKREEHNQHNKMPDKITELLENKAYTEVIHRAWPFIKDILFEQQMIMVAEDSEDDNRKIKGFVTAYRSLERFHRVGEVNAENKK